jgi:hypothetical protein
MQAWSGGKQGPGRRFGPRCPRRCCDRGGPAGGEDETVATLEEILKKGNRHQREEINVEAIRAKEETIPKPGGRRENVEQPM